MPADDVTEVTPVHPPRRARRRVAVAAVVAVLIVGAGETTWAATRDTGPAAAAAAGTDGCPGSVTTMAGHSPGVPAAPTASGTAGRLVPDREPTSVLLCEYPRDTEAGTSALGRNGAHAGGDATVAALVTAVRAATVLTGTTTVACASFGRGPAPVELVALTYDDGTVWVATSGTCTASNGAATSVVDIGTPVTIALDATGASTGDVTAAPVPSTSSLPAATAPAASGTAAPGGSGAPGAPGATTAPGADDPDVACAATGTATTGPLVPFTPVAVRVCHVDVDPSSSAPTAVDRGADVATGLASTLARLPTLEPDVACTAIGGERWALLFTAADGATAAVQVDAGGCGSATNGVTTVRGDAALYAALAAAR